MDEVKTKKKKIWLWIVLANVVLWSALIALLWDPTPDIKTTSTPERHAYIAATQMMKDNYMKVPDSTEFQPFEEVEIATDGENTYYVRLWIISQNALGVHVKSNYLITVRYEPEQEQWRFIDYKEG